MMLNNRKEKVSSAMQMKKKKHFLYEMIVWLALTVVVMYIFRLWPILLLIILVMFIVSMRLLILSSETVKSTDSNPVTEMPAPAIEPTVKDVIELAYAVILKQITRLVFVDYPNARWVWETSNAKQRIKDGDTVFIQLNHAGGYRRARVVIQNLQVVAIDYQSNKPENSIMTMVEELAEEELFEVEEPVENYELMAFEWVEKYTMELNNRCNEAIGEGLMEIMLTSEELPQKESWPDVCKELKALGLNDVEVMPEGIKLNLRSNLQKGNDE